MLRTLHLASRIEAVSYLVLLAAVVVKYAAHNEAGVRVMGPVHGVLYLLYVLTLLRWHTDLGWPFSKAVLAMVVGALPFGGFHIDRRWLP